MLCSLCLVKLLICKIEGSWFFMEKVITSLFLLGPLMLLASAKINGRDPVADHLSKALLEVPFFRSFSITGREDIWMVCRRLHAAPAAVVAIGDEQLDKKTFWPLPISLKDERHSQGSFGSRSCSSLPQPPP